jgi:hypothetical protein
LSQDGGERLRKEFPSRNPKISNGIPRGSVPFDRTPQDNCGRRFLSGRLRRNRERRLLGDLGVPSRTARSGAGFHVNGFPGGRCRSALWTGSGVPAGGWQGSPPGDLGVPWRTGSGWERQAFFGAGSGRDGGSGWVAAWRSPGSEAGGEEWDRSSVRPGSRWAMAAAFFVAGSGGEGGSGWGGGWGRRRFWSAANGRARRGHHLRRRVARRRGIALLSGGLATQEKSLNTGSIHKASIETEASKMNLPCLQTPFLQRLPFLISHPRLF